MPQFRVELRRLRPGPNQKVIVEHANHVVTASDLDDARTKATSAAASDSKDITWTESHVQGTRSGEGIAHVVATHALGPTSGPDPRTQSPVARSQPSAMPIPAGTQTSDVHVVSASASSGAQVQDTAAWQDQQDRNASVAAKASGSSSAA